jgi:glucose-1-phosphate thymidylyltransferase
MVRKAVVTAGGLATRLRPLTEATNKHMLGLYDRPIIQHVIETVVASGITDILVQLTNTFAQPVMQLLKTGEEFGCSIYYSYRPHGDSVAKQLAQAKKFTGHEPFLLMLGDSFYRAALPSVGKPAPHMWVMPLKGFDDHTKYAEVTLSSDGARVTSISTTVETPVTGIIQTGAWVFPPDVFERAARLVESTRREVMVRHIVSEYIDEGRMRATMLPPKSFLDLGTFEALHLASSLMRERVLNNKIAAE